MQIKDTLNNEYGRAKDLVGEKRLAFTANADASFDVCFENKLIDKSTNTHPPAPL